MTAPMFRPRFALAASALATLVAALAATGASAAPALPETAPEPVRLLDTRLAADGTTAAACHTRLRSGSPGVVTRAVPAPALGNVALKLDGGSGDWDVALFDADGDNLGGGASPGPDEVASGYALGRGTVTVQACRRDGASPGARLVASFTEIDRDQKIEKTQVVSVRTPTRFDKDRLTALGLDMTEHGGTESLGVVLHGKADEDVLRRAGFRWDVKIADLVAYDVRTRRLEQRDAARTRRSPLPSGRDTYRTLADYEFELKTLAQQNPGLIKIVELPNKTWEGRTVLAAEITTNVNANDGKPAFMNMGVHHAREWPSGEHAMEWLYELLNGYKGGDPRAKRIVEQSRNIIVPIVNPDGFNASRTAGVGADGGRDESVPDTAYLVAGGGTGGEYRRKNCRLGDTEEGNCATSVGLAEPGTDPNRNYGQFWGGPGADTNPATQTYRGPGPFSEPETRNIQSYVSRHHITTLITNHTTAGLVLRAPGLASIGDPIDENRGYKALGDAMAMENGYFSQKSFELYDTTGTTEDWSYNATGGYGFTFEIYCGDPNYATGDCDDPAFHPRHARVVEEWEGSSPQANHDEDPGKSTDNPFGMQANYDGKGNREAYYIAAESTLNEERHSVIEGEAFPGVTLRLTKSFKSETFPQENGQPITFDDKLDTTYDVGPSGRFRWHINPSTRPVVAKERGDRNGGTPAPAQQQQGSAGGVDNDADANDDNLAVACGDANTTDPTCYNEHRVTVPATGDNRSANIRVHWTSPASDWDVKIYEDSNANGDADVTDRQIGASENGATSEEEVGISNGGARLEAGKRYIVRVTNFAAGEPYTVDIKWNGPEPYRAAQTEAYTLTCEQGGRVLESQTILIDRNQKQNVDLAACRRALTALPPVPQVPVAPRCTAGSGFRSVSVRPRGRGLRFSFSRRVNRPVTVSVFQQSVGRSITGERLVARFTRRTRAFNWGGRATSNRKRVQNGYLFARFSIQTPDGVDVRRLTLRRSRGRFVRRPDFYRRATCDRLPSFKVERPVFGGRTNRALNISFRLDQTARVRLQVVRGTRVVARFGPSTRRAGVTHRLRVDPKRLRAGEYRIRITVEGGARPLTATLVARRL
jgi:murein tripeptide amidase MpaA